MLENQKLKLSINDSDKLKKKILESQSLLYIGDNCGEIVCDKLFINELIVNPLIMENILNYNNVIEIAIILKYILHNMKGS